MIAALVEALTAGAFLAAPFIIGGAWEWIRQ